MEKFLNYMVHLFVVSVGAILALAIFAAPIAVPIVIVACGGSGWWFLLALLYFPLAVIFTDVFNKGYPLLDD